MGCGSYSNGASGGILYARCGSYLDAGLGDGGSEEPFRHGGSGM